jgi:hyaluronoglucosaminidase
VLGRLLTAIAAILLLPTAAAGAALPTVSPAPQSIARAGGDAVLPGRVLLVVDGATDAPARTLLEQLLRSHGVSNLQVSGRGDPRRRR